MNFFKKLKRESVIAGIALSLLVFGFFISFLFAYFIIDKKTKNDLSIYEKCIELNGGFTKVYKDGLDRCSNTIPLTQPVTMKEPK